MCKFCQSFFQCRINKFCSWSLCTPFERLILGKLIVFATIIYICMTNTQGDFGVSSCVIMWWPIILLLHYWGSYKYKYRVRQTKNIQYIWCDEFSFANYNSSNSIWPIANPCKHSWKWDRKTYTFMLENLIHNKSLLLFYYPIVSQK